MMNFVNHGSDEDLLKSLQNDENVDQEELVKALDKSKLVQVERQVQGKNKMFTRKQWVKAGDVQSTDKVIGGQQPQKDKFKGSTKQELWDSLKSSGFEVDSADKSQPQKSITLYKDKAEYSATLNHYSNGDYEVLNIRKVSDSQPKQKSTYFKADQATKNTVNNIAQKMGNDKLLSWCHSVGVTWTENDHKGINIMRAKMALAQAIQEGKVSVGPKTSGKTDDSGNSPTLDKKSEPLKNQPSKLKGITDLTVLKNRLRVYIKNSLGDKFSAPKYGTSSIRGHKPAINHGLTLNIEDKNTGHEKLVISHTSGNPDSLNEVKKLLQSEGIDVGYYLDNPQSGALIINKNKIYNTGD